MINTCSYLHWDDANSADHLSSIYTEDGGLICEHTVLSMYGIVMDNCRNMFMILQTWLLIDKYDDTKLNVRDEHGFSSTPHHLRYQFPCLQKVCAQGIFSLFFCLIDNRYV